MHQVLYCVPKFVNAGTNFCARHMSSGFKSLWINFARRLDSKMVYPTLTR